MIKTMIMLSLIRFEISSRKAAWSLGMVSICQQQASWKPECIGRYLLPKTTKNAPKSARRLCWARTPSNSSLLSWCFWVSRHGYKASPASGRWTLDFHPGFGFCYHQLLHLLFISLSRVTLRHIDGGLGDPCTLWEKALRFVSLLERSKLFVEIITQAVLCFLVFLQQIKFWSINW